MLPAKTQYVLNTSEFDEVRTRLLDSHSGKEEGSGYPTLRRREPN